MCDKCGQPGGESYSFYYGTEKQNGKTTTRTVTGQASAVLCRDCLAKNRLRRILVDSPIAIVFGAAMFIGGIYGFNYLSFDLGAEGLIGLALKFVAICVIGGGGVVLWMSFGEFFGSLFGGAARLGPKLAIEVKRRQLEAEGANRFWVTLPQGATTPKE